MSKWLKTDPDNGALIGPDGCHYPNEKQAAHYGLLKLCGCGNPEAAYNFCRDALKIFDRRGGGEFIQAELYLTALIRDDPTTASHVFAHLLTHLRLMEHGGAVGGSWLTPDGARIVDMGPMTEAEMEADFGTG